MRTTKELEAVAPFPSQVFRSYEGRPSEDFGRYCHRCGALNESRTIGGRLRPVCGFCGHVSFRNPAPGVAVAILEGGRVLLGRRSEHVDFAGNWALPAGFIEFDEDFLSAARREVLEETGLEVSITGILNVSTNYLNERLHTLVVALAATPIGGDLRPGEEFSELRWFAPTETPPLAYEPDGALLSRLASGSLPMLPMDGRYAR